MDVASWLRSLGLERYESTFLANAIDSDILSGLAEIDFEKIGIPLGDRKRLMRAISEMSAGSGRDGLLGEPPQATKAAERRHLTVMICDLVGSTALSARLDPEDMGAVIDAYHAACARITLSYDGFLADFRGDGILAYFGYPRAHEDDAERTVRAGLDIITAVGGLETRAGEPLAVRIGIATGIVVVGDLGGEVKLRDHLVVGDAPNLAARLQTLVEPNTIVVAESTRRLLGDIFVLRDLGKHLLKGMGEPVGGWAVEGLSSSKSRFEAVRTAGPTELVNRTSEMSFLLDRQRQAWSGEGQAVLMSGEAGIGKSRLAAALADRIGAEPHWQFHYQCSPYHAGSALRPVIDQIERAAGFKTDNPPERRLDKLEAMLATAGTDVPAIAPLFAALLSIPFGERYPELTLSPAQQRRRTLAALLDQLEHHARQKPVLLLIEDVQWSDHTSLELLHLVLERMPKLPILALITHRADFEPPWTGMANVSVLALGRLDRDCVEGITMQIVNGRTLPNEIMKQIVAKTDGNPLFVEELTKAVLETGILVEHEGGYRLGGPAPSLAIPDTLQDSLMARLDRLHSVKEIAQVGAAIGREFSYRLIRSVVASNEHALKHALAELERAELVFRAGEPPNAIYRFKHALVRDAAYESLLRRRRQQLHGQIARTLEDRFPDIGLNEPELLAHHFTEAGLVEPAISYWLKAGHRALSRSANAEAVKHLRRGIELVRKLTSSAERARKELDFYLALGPAVAATEGDGAEETARVFSHARELLGGRGTLNEQMTIYWGAYLAHNMRAEHHTALDVARQCLALGAEHDHPGVSALAHRFMAQTQHFRGAFVESRLHLEKTLDLCARNPEAVTGYRSFGADDRVNTLAFQATTLLILGHPERSVEAWMETETAARAQGRAFTMALAFTNLAALGVIGGDLQHALANADEAIALGVENEFASLERRARFFRGALFAKAGNPRLGLELMQNALASVERNAEMNRRTLYLSQLASAHASLGQGEVALGLLDQAVRTAETTGERFFEAELYRLRGTILLSMRETGEGEAALKQALSIARRQQARWWELHAATDLAAHLRDGGQAVEADMILRPVYDWFIAGRETGDNVAESDLVDAKAVLDALRHAAEIKPPEHDDPPEAQRSHA